MKRLCATFLLWLGGASPAAADMQAVGRFEIDRTETAIGAFRAFVRTTGTVTAAEREGRGFVHAGSWRRMPDWTWATPFGRPGTDDEPRDFPAVHIGFRRARDLP
jgi:formylglycine-generating enzyme